MDNITHTIAGLMAADALGARSENKPLSQRRTILWISLISNNFPDLDFLYAFITPGRLGYLLHHRGHTHTLVGAIFSAALLALVAKPFTKNFKLPFLTALLGGGMHIFLDSWNSYGVHPFWPFNNDWYSLDFVFILEPIIWVAGGIYFWKTSRHKTVRFSTALFVAGTFFLMWYSDLVPTQIIFATFATSLIYLLLLIKFNALKTTFAYLGGMLSVFFISSLMSSSDLRNHLSKHKLDVISVAVSPAPANPFCYVGTVAARRGTSYVAETFLINPWQWKSCPPFEVSENVFANEVYENIQKVAFFARPFEELIGLRDNNCNFRAFLRFSKAPIWEHYKGAIAVSDLRFERGRSRSFSHIYFPKGTDCPTFVPPWTSLYENLNP